MSQPKGAERRNRLLTELADGFDKGACLLLDRDWLVKNDVTATECYDFCQDIADALRDVYGLKIP